LPVQNQTPLEIVQGNWEGRSHYLGHEDVLSTEAVVRVGVVVIDERNGEVCVLAQKVHGRDFRFGFDPGHEPASNPRDEFRAIDEGDQISLGRNRRRVPSRDWDSDVPCGTCLR
jgi:hypothetical protein